jgi:crotonobetainyl-CoA:carnitine CoA-transferase CaiB-like acyl-CoA transferase
MSALQAAGVASGVARLPIELLNDPQLQARGFIQQVDRAFIGLHPQPSMPFRETEKPFPIRSAPPTLGEHNREILGGLLGLSDAEIEQLTRRRHHRHRDADGRQLMKEKKRAAG